MKDLLRELRKWAESDEAVAAVALVGSHARGDARPGSDVDLVVLSSSPAQLLEDRGWMTRFGVVRAAEDEDWGRVTSLRVWYANDLEVEFSLATPDWATSPDDGTRRVASDGLRVLWDPNGLFESIT